MSQSAFCKLNFPDIFATLRERKNWPISILAPPRSTPALKTKIRSHEKIPSFKDFSHFPNAPWHAI